MKIKKSYQILCIFLLLIIGMPAYIGIPFYTWRGLDFYYWWIYHNCAGVNLSSVPYPDTIGSINCGDPSNRPMLGAPPAYWAYSWLRFISFASAEKIWEGLIVLSVSLAMLIVYRRSELNFRKPISVLLFSALLMCQFSMQFQLERGNNDFLLLLFIMVAAVFFLENRNVLSGIAIGLAALSKPTGAVASIIFIGGLLYSPLSTRNVPKIKDYLKLAATVLLTVVLPLAASWSDSKYYLINILSYTANMRADLNYYFHHIQGVAPNSAATWFGMSFILVLAWVIAIARNIETNSLFGFSGALAICTYFGGSSADYSLITVFPLLLWMFLRAQTNQEWLILGVGLILLVVSQMIYAIFAYFRWTDLKELWSPLRVILQFIWLTGVGVLAIRSQRVNFFGLKITPQ
jgi:Glycosyltransferase family 87